MQYCKYYLTIKLSMIQNISEDAENDVGGFTVKIKPQSFQPLLFPILNKEKFLVRIYDF